MDFINSNIKTFQIIFSVCLAIMILVSLIGGHYESSVTNQITRDQLGYYFKIFYFALFVIMGFCIPPTIISGVVGYISGLPIDTQSSFAGIISWVVKNKHAIISLYTYIGWAIEIIGLSLPFLILGNIFKQF